MLPLEHSAKLLTCIKRYLVLKPMVGLFESGHFRQVLLYIPMFLGPPVLDFGQVCLRSITTKNLNIVNNLDRHVLVIAEVSFHKYLAQMSCDM